MLLQFTYISYMTIDNNICMKLPEGYNFSNNAYSLEEYTLWIKAITTKKISFHVAVSMSVIKNQCST